MLGALKGIERRVWVQVGGAERVYAIADEDLERENDEKTSAVHFLRFELAQPLREALRRGARLTIGVDHPELPRGAGAVAASSAPRSPRTSLEALLAALACLRRWRPAADQPDRAATGSGSRKRSCAPAEQAVAPAAAIPRERRA